ncbi:hypothetical protein EX30DRAFT_360433 [Ascodesmis nigricans]|uniref:Nudix hydrolase domain-containing protein n=1 Tax=Ascodesmis nigricans TaxID=341454 RepID=A0A4S2MI09_9PEZI|nr:hypothetical protein EX30DRAFT_360433 [Ascodesmis nigricans]
MSKALEAVLRDLAAFPAPELASPEDCKRRAAVAAVFRIQPNPSHLPPPSATTSPASDLDTFFSQPWVQHGDPELLFIKRASRTGDRWTSHVAFPGGKRDPTDPTDHSSAIRECLEEVGLNLTSPGVLSVGHLPDRLIKTSWGTVPLLTLCPFVFLLTTPQTPELQLQGEEVASAHWVPWRLLFDPRLRTTESCDVADRLAKKRGTLVRKTLSLALGQMEFSAVRLWPGRSVFATFARDYLMPVEAGIFESPLVLWGVTLAVVEDLMEMQEPGIVELWDWPTFTAWDVKAVIRAWSSGLRTRNRKRAKEAVKGVMVERMVEEKVVVDMSDSLVLVEKEEVEVLAKRSQTFRERESTINILVDGYYDIVRKAVWATLAGRFVLGTAVVGGVVYRVLNRR